jgi:hypothetical protein
MNAFIAETIGALREQDIYALLVKGQGIAQCYEKPLWRPSGDIDLFLSKDNYGKAVSFFKNRYSNNKDGGQYSQEYAFYTDQWMIEVHGSLRTCLSSRIDKVVDPVQKNVFYGGNVRSWDNNGTLVFLPAPTEDVFLVFTHFIKHFYKEGMSLRQVCDWCRLLWTCRGKIDVVLLEKRLRKMDLLSEWKAFAAFTVNSLGMPVEAMPFHDGSKKYNRKANSICKLIIDAGNLGHNIDESYRSKYSGLAGNLITFWRRLGEFLKIVSVFPRNTLKFFVGYVFSRL